MSELLPTGRSEGYGACSDEGGASLEFLEGLELPGVACLLNQ